MSTPPKPRRPLGGRHNPLTDSEILDGLARHPDGAGPRALAETLKRCHTSLRLPLQRLVQAGKVERSGGRNGPTVRYHLAGGAPKAEAEAAKTEPPSTSTDAAVREFAAVARTRTATSARAATDPARSIRAHVLADRRDQLVSELELARLRVLEVEGQLAAVVAELRRASA